MPDVIFDEPKISQRERQEMRETSRFSNWIIKKGIARNEKEAILILLGFVIISIIVSMFLIFSGGTENNFSPKIMDDTFNQTIQN